MIEAILRPQYQKILVEPLVPLISNKVNANSITYLAGIFGVLSLPDLYYKQNTLAIFLILLSGYCDTLDCTLSRYNNKSGFVANL